MKERDRLAVRRWFGSGVGILDRAAKVPAFTSIELSVHVEVDDGQVGMVVSGGGNSVTTDSKGNYTLPVPKSTPYTMVVASGPNATASYLTLNEQEWQVFINSLRGLATTSANSGETKKV